MSPRLVRAIGLAVLILGPAACAPPDTSERGFGSIQVLHVRDTALSLRSTFSLDESGIYLARSVPDLMVSSDVPAPYDRTLITFATGVEQPIATGVLTVQLLPSADGLGRTLVMWQFPPDAPIPQMVTASVVQDIDLTFLDEVSGTLVTLPHVEGNSVDLGATRSDPILVRESDPDGNEVLMMGPPESLGPMPPGLNQVLGRDRVGFVGTSKPADGTLGQSFSRIPFDGSAPQEIIPGTLKNPQIVSGPDASPPPALTTVPNGWDGQGIFCLTPTDTNPTPPCTLFYDRRATQSGAGRLPFVHLLDTGTDLQLPGPLAGKLLDVDVLNIAPTGWDIFWRSPLDVTGATGAPPATRIYAWHVGQDHAASCDPAGVVGSPSFNVSAWRPLPAGAVAGPTTAGQFAVVAQPGSQTSEQPGSWTLIAGTAGVECHVVNPEQESNLIKEMSYAPDGSALAFLETDPVGSSKLYVTDGEAAAPPRVVATGPYFFNIDFHDPRHLLLWHSNTDGYSVSWLDLSSTPAVEHPIADRVVWDARDAWTWINPRWVVLADADSTDDGSYSLHVVDLETGTSKLISRGVVDFRMPWATPPPGATTLTVAYVVRSRTSSSQDGLWVAHLPLSDFPL